MLNINNIVDDKKVKIVWNGYEIEIKETITFSEMMNFVYNSTMLCFNEEDGSYTPEVIDFAIKNYMLETYTNMDLPDNADERYYLIYSTDIINVVYDKINKMQFDEIVNSVKLKVEHQARIRIEAINKQMIDLFDALNKLYEQLSKSFGDIKQEDLANILHIFSGDNSSNTKQIISAIMDREGVK